MITEEDLKTYDPQQTLKATDLLVEQCQTAWDEVNAVELPRHIEGITNIVFCGMGASIYGAIILKSLLGREMPYPTEFVSDYFLPDYVGEQTLVVLTSYSGTTEEVLSCAEEAREKNAKMVILTKGDKLADFAKAYDIPAYIFDGKLNISGTPRVGAGYTILGLMGLLNKMNVFNLEGKVIANTLIRMKEKLPEIKQQATDDYGLFHQKIPIIFAAEHLSGNAQILRNQYNEMSKAFATHFLIPDLNHHLMEGLAFPKGAPLHFIILNSPNYSPQIKKRVALTTEVVKQQNYPVHEFMTNGQSVYDDVFEVLQYGSYLSVYLGLAYKQNPAANPVVDWFKENLNK